MAQLDGFINSQGEGQLVLHFDPASIQGVGAAFRQALINASPCQGRHGSRHGAG